ncbi:hypothetical protein EBI_26642 [Enterocytozoon bieneusi H348]|nr:hypothetical protein EBI_26642 [Enterocytozoon bieneusi H348]|eukprot:XP_002652021.1 hypothetical protein EBI_26642 [Enterocytozoon bieneusi H348]
MGISSMQTTYKHISNATGFKKVVSSIAQNFHKLLNFSASPSKVEGFCVFSNMTSKSLKYTVPQRNDVFNRTVHFNTRVILYIQNLKPALHKQSAKYLSVLTR